MRHIAHIEDILPFLKICPCFKGRKPSFKHCLRKTLLEEMNIKMPKSDSLIISEPFLILGFGVNAFFDIIKSLMYLMLCIFVFTIPILMIYKENPQQGLKSLELSPVKFWFDSFSLGNLGGA